MFLPIDDKQTKQRLLVRVYYKGSPMGFYRARGVTHAGLLLENGAIIFPKGTALKIEFFDREHRPRFRLDAEVVDKHSEGMQLKFNFAPAQDRRTERWVVEWALPAQQRSSLSSNKV
jgi:hypothetical protein